MAVALECLICDGVQMLSSQPFAQKFRQPSDSESQLLSLVLRGIGTTQPELARRSGLSQQTVSRLVNDLVTRGALGRAIVRKWRAMQNEDDNFFIVDCVRP